MTREASTSGRGQVTPARPPWGGGQWGGRGCRLPLQPHQPPVGTAFFFLKGKKPQKLQLCFGRQSLPPSTGRARRQLIATPQHPAPGTGEPAPQPRTPPTFRGCLPPGVPAAPEVSQGEEEGRWGSGDGEEAFSRVLRGWLVGGQGEGEGPRPRGRGPGCPGGLRNAWTGLQVPGLKVALPSAGSATCRKPSASALQEQPGNPGGRSGGGGTGLLGPSAGQ